MADNMELSSAELYKRKSNRRLLVVALVAFFAFLIGLMLLSGGSKRVEEVEKPVVVYQEPGSERNMNEGFDLRGRSTSAPELTAYPLAVSMPNVVLGSSSQAVVTLTAKGAPIRIDEMTLAENQTDGFVVNQTENCGVGKVIREGESCNIQILWNPISIRSYSNYLTVRWRKDDPTAYPPPEQKVLRIDISGQSTDSANCVICETKEAERMAAIKGKLDEKNATLY